MPRPISADNTFVGSFSEVFRGRGWSRPTRQVEITLGECRYWKDGKYHEGEQHVFRFNSVEDARLVANAIAAEVKHVKAIGS